MSPDRTALAQPDNWGKRQRVHQVTLAVSKNRKNERIPHIYKHKKTVRPKRGGKGVKRFKRVPPKNAKAILPWWLAQEKFKQNLNHKNSRRIGPSDILSLWKRQIASWVGRETPTMAILYPKRDLPKRGLAGRAGNRHLHAPRFWRSSKFGRKDVKKDRKWARKGP